MTHAERLPAAPVATSPAAPRGPASVLAQSALLLLAAIQWIDDTVRWEWTCWVWNYSYIWHCALVRFHEGDTFRLWI